MKKMTQKEAIFYALYHNHKSGKHDFIPVFKFMGEIYCEEFGIWGFVSHECSARCSDIRRENPRLLDEPEKRKARAGGIYYCYRLKPDVKASDILDPRLIKFHRMLHNHYQKQIPVDCGGKPQGVHCGQANCTSCNTVSV